MKTSAPTTEYIPTAISFLLVMLWVYAAVSKLKDLDMFTTQLGQSPLLHPYAGLIAMIIPAIEIAIAIALAIDKYRMAGLYASFGLLALFTAYIVAITGFAYFIPCSCGGLLENLTWRDHLIFNGTLAMLCVIAMFLKNNSSTNNLLQQTGSPGNLETIPGKTIHQ